MTRRPVRIALFIAAVAVGCAQPQADDAGLRDSFAERISSSSFVK